MKTQNFKSRSLVGASVAVIGLAMISTPAFAQAAAEEPAADTQIVVTGSRIARPDIESASPVTVVSAEELRATGTTRVEDLINTLPQAVGGQNGFISNGSSGTATVDLRGLGSTRTLVLVNGRRLQPGDPSLPVADLNQIPGSLVKRIDVLTGGASATYGADAVSGVVNFVMNTDFKGFEVTSQYSFYQHNNSNDQVVDTVGSTDFTTRDRLNARRFGYPDGNVVDGAAWDSTVTFGAGFDDGRGNIAAYLGYRQVSPILQRDRDHSSCAISINVNTGRNVCGGSSTAPAATITDLNFGDEIFASASGGGVFGPFAGAYNFAPVNYFQRPDKRWTAGMFADYEISPAVKAYAEFMFMDNRSVAQIAESGTFFARYDIACNSPLLTAAQGTQLCAALDTPAAETGKIDKVAGDGIVSLLIGKRNVEGGPRRDDLRHTSYRGVLGFKGDISDNWSYDVSGQFGTTVFAETYFNDLSTSRLTKALDAVVGPDGNVVCAVNADAISSNNDAACAPYNPFQGVGIVSDPRLGITQAALTYVNTPGFQRGDTKEYIVSGFVQGKLGSIFGAAPASILFGTEYRKEHLTRNVDEAFRTGDLRGQGGPVPNVAGGFTVKEAFTELLLPIVEDQPFAKSMSLELAYRYSDYSTAGTTSTYKIVGEYSPVSAVKFRGGFNRAVRAPNVLNLFSPQNLGLFGGSDPCAGPAVAGSDGVLRVGGSALDTSGSTAAQCLFSGVSATRFGKIAASPAGQYNQLSGGDPNLETERANTWTAGVVIEPRDIVPGLALKVDYYNIKVGNAISTLGAQTILNQCVATGDPLFCSKVVREPGSASLFAGSNNFVRNLTQNIGGVKTSGIDVSLTYGRNIGPGRVTLDFNGTYVEKFTVDNGFKPVVGTVPQGFTKPDGKYDCVGYFGSTCGTPLPNWRHTMRLGYKLESGIGLSVRWRYLNGVKVDQFSRDLDLSSKVTPDARGKIGSYNLFDLTATASIGENADFVFGVNNILDKDPPVQSQTFGTTNANTFVETYDPVGRYIFIGGTLKF